MAVVGAALATTMVAASAHAQLAMSRSDKRVLFLIPQADTVADTTFAQELAEEVRRRMRTEFRQKLAIVPTNDICTVLQESAYPCTVVLGAADADRLARAVRAYTTSAAEFGPWAPGLGRNRIGTEGAVALEKSIRQHLKRHEQIT